MSHAVEETGQTGVRKREGVVVAEALMHAGGERQTHVEKVQNLIGVVLLVWCCWCGVIGV